METIKQLRQRGIKVMVSHFRRAIVTNEEKLLSKGVSSTVIIKLESEIRKDNLVFLPKGGLTQLFITYKGRDYIVSHYFDDDENYIKKLGIQKAIEKFNFLIS